MSDTGATEAATWLGEIADRLRDPAPAFAAEARIVNRIIDVAFETDTAPSGRRWAPRGGRSSRDAARGEPNERTGRLRASAGASVVDGALVVSATAPYAGHVQKARPFLPLDENLEPLTTGPGGEWYEGLEERVADYFVDGTVAR